MFNFKIDIGELDINEEHLSNNFFKPVYGVICTDNLVEKMFNKKIFGGEDIVECISFRILDDSDWNFKF